MEFGNSCFTFFGTSPKRCSVLFNNLLNLKVNHILVLLIVTQNGLHFNYCAREVLSNIFSVQHNIYSVYTCGTNLNNNQWTKKTLPATFFPQNLTRTTVPLSPAWTTTPTTLIVTQVSRGNQLTKKSPTKLHSLASFARLEPCGPTKATFPKVVRLENLNTLHHFVLRSECAVCA